MTSLFDETTIRGMTLSNRLARSATWEGMCDPEGRPTEKLIECYRDLARGGIGLIFSGYSYIRPDGKQAPGKLGIYSDEFASEMQAMVRAVHDEGGKICIQLVHAGGQADPENASGEPLAPSAVQVENLYKAMPREMSVEDIRAVVDAFGAAAHRAKAYGFDGVQLHGAHGFLINQFLSPLTNRRTDEYGGSIENRTRFLLEVYRTVRETVGPDYPVMIKLTAADFMDGGLETEDAVYAAAKLSEAGIDAIEVSAGTGASGDMGPARVKINKPEQEAYNLELAKKIKAAVSCPVMIVGGMRSFEVAEKSIDSDGMDYISMSRPFIREPGLANRWAGGDTAKAKCISCNGCFGPAMQGEGIYCVVEAKLKEKKS